MATKRPDLSEFYRYSRPKKPPCRVGHALAQIEDEADNANLVAALAQESNVITGAAIIKWLEVRGITDISGSSIASHRGKKCSCYA